MYPSIHKRYVEIALGNRLSKDLVRVIANASKRADAVYNHFPAQHANRNIKKNPENLPEDIRDTVIYILTVQDFVVKKLLDASNIVKADGVKALFKTNSDKFIKSSREKLDQLVVEAGAAFGFELHALHDIFSHSNLLNIDWKGKLLKDLLKDPTIPLPENLFTATFGLASEASGLINWNYLASFKPLKKKQLVQELISIYKKKPQFPNFIPHYWNNLDGPGTPKGAILEAEHGVPGFKRASKLAIKFSQDRFDDVIRILLESLPRKEAKKLLKILKKWEPNSPKLIKNSNSIGQTALDPHIKDFRSYGNYEILNL